MTTTQHDDDKDKADLNQIGFSLFYFASDEGNKAIDKYHLLLEGAKFADKHNFEAIWTPERHFDIFGGLYPNPAITASAVAAITRRIKIRAGSCVLPLHNPIRVAEDWSVVDNLSNGRAGLGVAAGFHPDDFTIAPDKYSNRRQSIIKDIEIIKSLWKGDTLSLPNGNGSIVQVKIRPLPVQPSLPLWITTAGNTEAFRYAGESGNNILTHLMGHSIDELASKIAIYRETWSAKGHAGHGHVSIMIHTFVANDQDYVLSTVKEPFKKYLAQSFSSPEFLAKHLGIKLDNTTSRDISAMLDISFKRYYESYALLGTPARCLPLVQAIKNAGVNEIACLIDFGIETDIVLNNLIYLDELRQLAIPVSQTTIAENKSTTKLPLKTTCFYKDKTDQNRRTHSSFIHELFESQVKATPNAIALVYENQQLSYQALNKKSNQLANYLLNIGVKPDSRVGLCVKRSLDMFVGVLGILKAGGAYVPITPDCPPDRMKYIVQDASISILITQTTLTNQYITSTEATLIDLNNKDTLSQLVQAPDMSVNANTHQLHPSNLAYVIYTSGSTGNPKGVLISHQGLENLSRCQRNLFDITGQSRVLQYASLDFDVATWEWIMAFTNGARLCLIKDNVAKSNEELTHWAQHYQITHATLPPAILPYLDPDLFSSLTHFIVAGEPCPETVAQQWCERRYFFNAYGPTEITVCASIYAYTKASPRVCIGRPLNNIDVYVLDKHLNPPPIGVQGELYIGGVGLARGYLNQADLTAETFIPNPFSNTPGDRLYRSGDVVRYLADGNLDFIGRWDHQVKIRGYRIELDEIKTLLLRCELLRNAEVVVREDIIGDKRLVAYIVPCQKDIQSIDKNDYPIELAQYLEKNLPAYMVPSAYVVLESLPLMSNGKVNQHALPAPNITALRTKEFRLASNYIESALVTIWQALLGIEKISILDNFFELGGNSLKLLEMKNIVDNELHVNIAAVDLFTYPSIATLSSFLTKNSTTSVGSKLAALSQEANLLQKNQFAIIGMSGRFPSAKNINDFWSLLLSGKEGLSTFSTQELLEAGVPYDVVTNTNFVRKAGIVAEKNLFDAHLFNYSAKEASRMDPQFSVFHECVWEALENAGYGSESPNYLVGIYAGCGDGTAWSSQLNKAENSPADTFSDHTLSGSNFLCTRIAHKFDFKGPALSVQTACSTSLVAVHLACQALSHEECDIALAGGIALSPQQKGGYLYQEDMILSSDGFCRPFDANANGTVGGEGAGVLVLKRLAQAIEDNDTILAVIKGSAINNDGYQKVGYTAPSVKGQVEVIKAAQKKAKVSPQSISYIETHGTGTKLGDPIEIAALTKAFGDVKNGFCKIGSVKSNIGHLDTAAGIAGIIKTVLALQHKQIPPSLHFKKPNPHIDFKNSPFQVKTSLWDWDTEHIPRRAGVSSFGIGGTNAHIVLEEAPFKPKTGESRIPQMLCLSANSRAALEKISENLCAYTEQHADLSLADLCYTLHVGRKSLPYRKSCVVTDINEVKNALNDATKSKVFVGKVSAEDNKICFLFPGQGTQYINMGRDLYEKEKEFRDTIDHCFTIAHSLSDIDFKRCLFPNDVTEKSDLNINQTAVTQPLLFIFEYALANLLITWGCRPTSMIGHSVGEYVAACLAGVFSLEDGINLMIQRGALIQTLPPGSMLSVLASEATIKRLLNHELQHTQLCVAAVNCTNRLVLSGDDIAIQDLIKILDKKDIQHTMLPTSHAFHSYHMDPVLDKFKAIVKTIRLSAPIIPFISNISGNFISNEQAISSDYWVQHLRNTVQFSKGVESLCDQGKQTYIEVGPGQVLSAFVMQSPASVNDQLRCISTVRGFKQIRNDIESDQQFLINRLCQLFVSCQPLDWGAYYANEKRTRIPLPTYPFERKNYWQLKQKNCPTEKKRSDTLLQQNSESKLSTQPATQHPSIDTELKTLWTHTLGVDHVDDNDNFFDIGGDSLSAISLASKIGFKFDVKISLNHMFQYPTVRDQANFLINRTDNTELECITNMQPEGNKTPVFMVPGLGGYSYVFNELAIRIDAEHPIFGFNALGLDGITIPHQDILSTAQYYTELISNIYPQGPYILLGHSLGALIAFEMVKIFESKNTEVPLLIILDGLSSISENRSLDPLTLQKKSIAIFNQALSHGMCITEKKHSHLSEKAQIQVTNDKFRKSAMINKNVDCANILNVIKAQLSMHYQPSGEKISHILVIQSEDNINSLKEQWNDLSINPVSYYVVPGDHSSMLKAPYADEVAEIIQKYIC